MQNEFLSQNSPNNSLMFSSFTPIFGNLNFQIAPSMTGEVSNSYGVIPYLSLESLIYMQQIQAQVAPNNVLPGQNTGQQNIRGQFTITDTTGTPRMIAGYSSGGF